MSTDWNARTILKTICDQPLRQAVLESFWTSAEDNTRAQTLLQLASSLHFRPETMRKASVARKAELLASRLAAHEFQEALEIALMTYHTTKSKELLAAFLDEWGIPHDDGTIEADDYSIPSTTQIESAVEKLRDRFSMREIILYLATAGLLMGGALPRWREAAWPVVDRLTTQPEA